MAIVLGTAISPLPSSEFRFVSQARKSSSTRGTNPRLCVLEHRGLEDDSPCSSSSTTTTTTIDSYRSSSCTSCGRRGLMLTATIPFVFPLHRLAIAVAADADESSIIQNGVRSVLTKVKAAGVLRLVFHDAGTFDKDDNSGSGMNGSIVYELDRPENGGLSKSAKVLEKAKREIDKIRQVSWADLIAVAGAEAVSLCGGPVIPVRLGRVDARMPDPQERLPQESLDASGLKRCFLKKGFSIICGKQLQPSSGCTNEDMRGHYFVDDMVYAERCEL